MKCNECVHYKLCRDLFCQVDTLTDDDKKCDYYEPVRPHGEWKEFNVATYRGTDECGEPKCGKGKICICSRCGRRTVIKENFCPACGSDNRKKGGDPE